MSGESYLLGKLRWIARTWRPHVHWIPLLVVMTFVSTGATLAYPLVFGYVLEQIRSLEVGVELTADVDAQVQKLIGLLLVIGAARFVASFYPAFRGIVNCRIEWFTRERFFQLVLRKGHGFFTRFRTGDIITRLTDDIAGYPKIAWFCCSGWFRALDSLSRVVCCLGVMFWLHPLLAAYSLLSVPPTVLVWLALKKRMAKAVLDQRQAASTTSEFLEASFSGVTVLQAHDAQDRLGDALAEQLGDRAEAEVRLAHTWVLFSIFFQALNVVGQMVVVVVGGLWVIDGSLSLGTFFSFYLYLGLLLGPMLDLPNLLVTGRQAFVCMERLDELEAFGREHDAGRGEAILGALERVQLRDLRFGYPTGGEPAPVLDGLNLDLSSGDRLAVVGEIGAGKTTLVRAMAGILRPDEGSVRLNGQEQLSLDGPALRRAVGFVPQDPVLFSATVRENILLGRDEEPERLARALEFAGLADEVAAMPGGLDYRLGLRGRGLSGGQRQRLTIARALYGDPQLLLLDDITAALDAENEDRFWERVFEAWPEATVLVVTHRAATARRMARVLRLEGGALVDAGSDALAVAR